MKTLEEIKDEYAREKHYDNWRQLFMRGTEKAVLKAFEETAERYAQEYYKSKAKDLLERAAERATAKLGTKHTPAIGHGNYNVEPCAIVDKQSITETPLD